MPPRPISLTTIGWKTITSPWSSPRICIRSVSRLSVRGSSDAVIAARLYHVERPSKAGRDGRADLARPAKAGRYDGCNGWTLRSDATAGRSVHRHSRLWSEDLDVGGFGDF